MLLFHNRQRTAVFTGYGKEGRVRFGTRPCQTFSRCDLMNLDYFMKSDTFSGVTLT